MYLQMGLLIWNVGFAQLPFGSYIFQRSMIGSHQKEAASALLSQLILKHLQTLIEPWAPAIPTLAQARPSQHDICQVLTQVSKLGEKFDMHTNSLTKDV